MPPRGGPPVRLWLFVPVLSGRVEPGPYGRIPEAAPFPAAGPMCSAENCRFRQICSFLRQELRNFVQFILKTSCIFPRAMV